VHAGGGPHRRWSRNSKRSSIRCSPSSPFRHRGDTDCAPRIWVRAGSRHLRRYLSHFPGCRNAEHSEQVLGCFLLAAEQMHR
jgi:hypothetical protein